jgi:hypothetical protein
MNACINVLQNEQKKGPLIHGNMSDTYSAKMGMQGRRENCVLGSRNKSLSGIALVAKEVDQMAGVFISDK